jgi:uncharacterized protein YbbK (DUF523 family)
MLRLQNKEKELRSILIRSNKMKDNVFAISACLLGVNCKYNGKSNLNPNVIEYLHGKEVVLVCPELLGGLTTPRIISEIQENNSVKNLENVDVTDNFILGAKRTLEILHQNNCKNIILKDGSPSCGFMTIYDGSFTGKRIKGMGITARYLRENGINILNLET